ncbi:MAG: M20/M25/M40 family metallo-hydrolase, partial [Phycisphaerales bacterium]|nr:M20/M25/M40 family metallo-hydrolase [Phycisphaerales bacterium]
GQVAVRWERLWQIEPILFHEQLIALCDESIAELGQPTIRLPSGPLHDAAEVSRAGIPTVMIFVQSLLGISHNKLEDTLESHIELSATALDRLAQKTMVWIGDFAPATKASSQPSGSPNC